MFGYYNNSETIRELVRFFCGLYSSVHVTTYHVAELIMSLICMKFHYTSSILLILPLILQIGYCNLVTKFPNDLKKEGRWWINYLKVNRRNCWVPKGHIYLKVANLSIENTLLVDEVAFYFTTCILEERGRPALLCNSEEDGEEISIRTCAKNNGFAWSLFDSFANKIPLITLVENLEISNSDFQRMKIMIDHDVNLLVRENADPLIPHKPIFHVIRENLHNYIIQRDRLNDYGVFLQGVLDSVTLYVSERIMEVDNFLNQ